MKMSEPTRKILVTRDRIDEGVVALLARGGYQCLFSPPSTPSGEVARIAREAQVCAIMVSQGKITRQVIDASPELRVIAKHGSGVNNINLQAAEDRGIPVFRAVGANARAVAEHGIALMLALRKSLPYLDAATKRGEWIKGGFVGKDILGAQLGLVGLGAIGRETARLATLLGMNVRAYDPAMSGQAAPQGITLCDTIGALAEVSDILSLHCPLVPSTRHLINADLLARMPRHAVLINTARGGIIDEEALARALHDGTIAGAGIDSFETEPPGADNPLFGAPNLVVTPHAAGLTAGAEGAMAGMAARFIMDTIEGKNVPVEYRATAATLGGLVE